LNSYSEDSVSEELESVRANIFNSGTRKYWYNFTPKQ